MDTIENFCKLMPKAELHAHLNGSISEKTLKNLINDKKRRCSDYVIANDFVVDEHRTLDEIFKMFPLIHEVTDTIEAVYLATMDVIREFAEDNVKYLEIRTTPKEILKNGMTKQNYVDAVIKAINDSADQNITVKLLLSIDRKNGLSDAQDTIKLADSLFHSENPIVGLDLSGNPLVDGLQYMKLLRNAKNSGFKISLHTAEVPDTIEENFTFLNLPPNRIGHGTFLHRNKDLVENVSRMKIPLEICLSSNIKGLMVDSYANHHFKYWFDKNHPLSICTDDKGLFQTTLSHEYRILSETFQLTENNLFDLSKKSLDYAFVDEDTKMSLRTIWSKFYVDHFQSAIKL